MAAKSEGEMGVSRKRIARAAMAVAFAAMLVVHARVADAETLHQAMTAAYKFNPRLDAERANLRATDEEVPRALSGYRPQIFGSADVGYQRSKTRGGGDTSVQETNRADTGWISLSRFFAGFGR